MNSTKVAEVRISKLRIHLFGTVFAVISALLCLLLAHIRGYRFEQSSLWDYPLILAFIILIGVIHELLHGLAAFFFGTIHWSDLHFGINWRYMAVVCHLKAPISVKAVRIVGIAPLAITVPVTFVILLLYPTKVTAILAAFTLAACIVDLIMLYELRRFDGQLLFVDHPSEPGFDIYDSRKIGDGNSANNE